MKRHHNKKNMEKVIELLKQARKKGQQVFVCGNGGSSSTAEHFTNDLFSREVKAVCLNSNTTLLTMIANDFGYQNVFKRQLDLFAQPDDLLIVFSCSGTSPNIVAALKTPLTRIAILGRGHQAKKLADFCLLIDSDDYGVIESEHLAIAHKIAKRLNKQL